MHELKGLREKVALQETFIDADAEHDARELGLAQKELALSQKEVELLQRELDLFRREIEVKDQKIVFLETSLEAMKGGGICWKRVFTFGIRGC